MENDTYTQTMDILVNGLRTFHAITSVATDEDVTFMQETIERADSLGAVMYPSEYKKGLKSLQNQRRILNLIRHIRKETEAIEWAL